MIEPASAAMSALLISWLATGATVCLTARSQACRTLQGFQLCRSFATFSLAHAVLWFFLGVFFACSSAWGTRVDHPAANDQPEVREVAK